MGITAKLEDERGEALATVEDPRNVLHRILPQKGGLLAYIDWYGDTVYNHLQAGQFLAEWDELHGKVHDEDDQRIFSEIRNLAMRLQGERHLYLKFYGD
jgi:hypothetical protein